MSNSVVTHKLIPDCQVPNDCGWSVTRCCPLVKVTLVNGEYLYKDGKLVKEKHE